MAKIIVTERQLNLIAKNTINEQYGGDTNEDSPLIPYCDCVDGTIQFACESCDSCCSSNGGWMESTIAPIVGMGDVSYSYDDGPIETSNSSSSFGYVDPN
tara:strand:- start:571 stop:870 length:300 start_codon:yes stop_codon:yes gene_type:complete